MKKFLILLILLATPCDSAFVANRGKMLFIGDSISKGMVSGYGTSGGVLAGSLKDTWIVYFTNPPTPSLMGTPSVLTNLATWLGERDFDYIVFQIGAHNLVWDPTTSVQYQTDVGTIMTSLIAEVGSSANILAINILQVDEVASGLTDFNTDVVAYNTALATVCAAQSPAVPVYDLFTLTDPDTGPYEGQRDPDGIHYTAAGYTSIAGVIDTWMKAP
jgi:lysophospholipase L1-like esterase